jgi:carboxymethylenebutenolidase
MALHVFDGRRFLVQVLLGVNLVIWGAALAWADDKPSAVQRRPTEYVEDAFEAGGQSIPVWRFEPRAEGKQPAVLLLYGADGLDSGKDMYGAAAKRLAGKGYVVFLVHYLDATPPEDRKRISDLVKRGLRGVATDEEARRAYGHFLIWMDCVRDAVAHVRQQPGVDSERVGVVGISLGGFVGLACASHADLRLSAVISCFGGLPRAMHPQLQLLPPTLVVHGAKDDVVPVAEAEALRALGRDKKLVIEAVIYPQVGHVFQTPEGRFDLKTLIDAERRMTEHLQKYLKVASHSMRNK